MSSHSKLDKEVFNEFYNNWDNLLLDSEILLEKYSKKENILGKEKITQIKQRVNQNIFRKIVLSNYDNSCAICKINNTKLLVASHIIPWAKNEKDRLNPHNGICLCSIHDKAFDKGLITIDINFKLILSKEIKKLNKKPLNNFFISYLDEGLNLPKKFYPYPNFLEYHNKNIFLGT